MKTSCLIAARSLLMVSVASNACALDAGVSGDRQTRQEPQPRASLPKADFRDTFRLEFDLDRQFLERDSKGEFVVSAFQVGFFAGRGLVRTIEIPRSRAEISGNRMALVVPVVALERERSGDHEVRVRGLTSGPLGAWSSVAGSVKLPSMAGERARARRARSRR